MWQIRYTSKKRPTQSVTKGKKRSFDDFLENLQQAINFILAMELTSGKMIIKTWDCPGND